MDDLISEFITETTDSLGLLDQELVKLEQNPNDSAILGNIFRIVHTIKGTCGFLGLPRLESVAHASENVLGKIRDGEREANAQAVTLVLESLDHIKSLIDFLSNNGKEPDGSDVDLIRRLNLLADTGTIDGAGAAPAAPSGPVLVETTPAPVATEDFSSHFKGDDDLDALMAEAAAKKAAGHAEVSEEAADRQMVATDAHPAPKLVEAAKPAPAAAAHAPAAAPAGEKGGEGAGAAQSIRVNLDVLENLMQLVGELVLTRNQLLQVARTRDDEDRDFLAPLQQLSHITTDLQEGVMKTRMQPIGNAWSKFPRLIRDLSLELGKKIELKMIGAETELDRQLLEMIKDPLTHMVRNSCDHGLEMPADRKAGGKAESGTVTLHAYHEGGHIIIDIIDDGKGLNVNRIREKAVTNNLATQTEIDAMSDQQVMQFIFRAGFSTAEKVTAVSGRGVGMDVVRTNIEKIGGTIELKSELGKGSTFSIKIPLTLAIVSVLIVEVAGQKFAIPQINVVELVRASSGSEQHIETLNKAPVIRLREKLLPLGVLDDILKVNTETKEWADRDAFIVVCKVGGYDFGLIVDRVYDTEEIVVKPVSEMLKNINVYSGNTILGDGSVIMILDPNGLSKSIGEISISDESKDTAAKVISEDEKMVSFLLFTAGKGAPKAVPLELLSRLEEIEIANIEIAGDHPVVQYRGDLMKLVQLDNTYKLPTEGAVEVLVFTYDKKTIGLVVESIIDIVHSPLKVKMASQDKNYLGSMVIAGKTTEVVDVSNLLSGMIGEIVTDNTKMSKEKAASYRVLLVEDSPFFRNLTVPFLSSAGYKVNAVESGAEALKLIQAGENFDLVVTDIEMPGMDGFQLASTLRALPSMSDVPILAYTASLSTEVMNKGRNAGMKECIVKTDRPGLLQAVSRYVMGEKEMAA